MKIIAISGSLRQHSLNSKLLAEAGSMKPDDVTITPYEIQEIPLFNGDLEEDGDPEAVLSLKRALKESDGLLIVTPEYHESMPGVIKNVLDWVGSDANENVLRNLPVGVIGASPTRFGTAHAQKQVKQALIAAGSEVFQKPEVYVAKANEKFDDKGNLTDERTQKAVTRYLQSFSSWIGEKI
ncbi:NADPH-dependent FMN reductase [Geomicrobium sp. JCM 19055]|uniref:NADPH-dependent FMN reductase n=1 Tax=Geomicrobium sp. JCM 19055 TaxID=1460649 RepID=UPI00045ED71E|nr:NADPH-dependent FMN reductase [Geomicrobium sp. JCM 19055]GAK00935.1 NADPH:quinone oxidoreductase [Geomicrobium sp. JCM 19055]